MNKFFKSIATIIISSIVVLATSAQAQQDKFAVKEGSYIGTLISEKEGVLTRAYAQIVIEKDGTGAFRQHSFTSPCHKGELKLLQKRDPSGQLMFEVTPSGDKDKCHKLYYFVDQKEGIFTTKFVLANSKGNYARPHDEFGRWTKN